jgi:hypothetical protein
LKTNSLIGPFLSTALPTGSIVLLRASGKPLAGKPTSGLVDDDAAVGSLVL